MKAGVVMRKVLTYHDYWFLVKQDPQYDISEFLSSFSKVFDEEISNMPHYPENAGLLDFVRIREAMYDSIMSVSDEP